jgi:hypothetical protein
MESWASDRQKWGRTDLVHRGTGDGVYDCGTRWKLSFSLGKYTAVSRQKCVPSRHVWLRIWIDITGTGTSVFSQIFKPQLKLLATFGSSQNWSGTATSPPDDMGVG